MTSPEPEAPGPATEAAAIPVAPAAPEPVDLPSAPSFPEALTEPATTSSGFPNPHGLPEIAIERPEVGVGGAFAGGLVLALILKRLAR